MALVGKATIESDLYQLEFTSEQQLPRSSGSVSSGAIDGAAILAARRKTAGEMAGGQATFLRGEVRDRGVAVEMSFDESVGTPKLPGREPRADAVLPLSRRAAIVACMT